MPEASNLTERLLALAGETDLIDADWSRESVAELAREAADALEQTEKALREIARPDANVKYHAAWYGWAQKVAREALAALKGTDG